MCSDSNDTWSGTSYATFLLSFHIAFLAVILENVEKDVFTVLICLKEIFWRETGLSADSGIRGVFISNFHFRDSNIS